MGFRKNLFSHGSHGVGVFIDAPPLVNMPYKRTGRPNGRPPKNDVPGSAPTAHAADVIIPTEDLTPPPTPEPVAAPKPKAKASEWKDSPTGYYPCGKKHRRPTDIVPTKEEPVVMIHLPDGKYQAVKGQPFYIPKVTEEDLEQCRQLMTPEGLKLWFARLVSGLDVAPEVRNSLPMLQFRAKQGEVLAKMIGLMADKGNFTAIHVGAETPQDKVVFNLLSNGRSRLPDMVQEEPTDAITVEAEDDAKVG